MGIWCEHYWVGEEGLHTRATSKYKSGFPVAPPIEAEHYSGCRGHPGADSIARSPSPFRFHQDIQPWRHQVGTVSSQVTGNFPFSCSKRHELRESTWSLPRLKKRPFRRLSNTRKRFTGCRSASWES